MVERRSPKPRVEGSNPSCPAIRIVMKDKAGLSGLVEKGENVRKFKDLFRGSEIGIQKNFLAESR